MPRMTGLELVKNIRSLSDTAQFIILTAYPNFEYAKQAIDYTVASYLLKPLKNSDLIDVLLSIKAKKEAKTSDALSASTPDFVDNSAPILTDHQLEELVSALAAHDTQKVHEITENYFNLLKSEPDISFDAIKDNVGQIIVIIVKQVIKHSALSNEIFGRTLQPFSELKHLHTISEIQAYFEGILDVILNSSKLYSFINASPIVKSAISYITEHYNEKISTGIVAEKLYVSNEHLMRLFKNDTGLTFSEYLANYRINTAIKLLKSNKYKVYEVCNMVGYTNIIYFNKLFKKVTGHSPSYYTTERKD